MKFLDSIAGMAKKFYIKFLALGQSRQELLDGAEHIKGWAAIVSIVAIVILTSLLVWQFQNRVLFAQVDAVTQTIELTISAGEDLFWKMPTKVRGCSGELPMGLSTDNASRGTLVVPPGTFVVITRNGKGLFLETTHKNANDTNENLSDEPMTSGVSLESADGSERYKLAARQCLKIDEFDATESMNWAIRGELTVGDDFSGSVGQQNLLLSGTVNLYQAESKGAERLPDSLILLQSRTLNIGEQLTFQRQEKPLIKPAEMVGIIRMEPDVKSLTISAFGRVEVATTKKPLRAAEYKIKGDFVNMIYAMLRDGNQSYLLLALLVFWFIFSKHFLDK